MTEVGNTFSRHDRRLMAKDQLDFVHAVLKVRRGQVISVESGLWQRGWDLYWSRLDQDWGHTDCISFVVMQELGITTAFTGDKHFEQAGFVRLVKG